MRHGGEPPPWVTVLIAAEAWGIPPWELAEGGNRLLWLNRFIFYRNQIMQKENEDLEGLGES